MRTGWREIRLSRDWLVWLLLLFGLIACVGYLDIIRDIGQPFGGYISFRRTAEPVGQVDANTPIWWSGMVRDRLDHDDILPQINQQPYYPGVRDLYAAAAAADARTVLVDSIRRIGGETRQVELPITTFRFSEFIDVRLPDIIMTVVFWLLAVVVYRSWPEGPANRAFAVAAGLVSVVRALYVHTVFMDDAFSISVELIFQTAIPILGVAFIHFAGQFPVQARPAWRWITRGALVIALVASIAAVAARLPGLPAPPLPAYDWFADLSYFGTIVVYFAGIILLFGRLIHRLVRRRAILSRREKRTMLIVLLGLAIALPMLVASALTWITIAGRQISYFWQGLDLRFMLMAIPLSLAYVLVRYQALRSPSPLFILVMAISASALIAAFGAWIWTLGHPPWPENGLRPPFITLFTAALLSSLVWIGLTFWRGPLGRYFQHDRRTYDAVRSFGRRVMGETDLKLLPQTMAQALVDEFELERATVWVGFSQLGELYLAGSAGDFPKPAPQHLKPSFAGRSTTPLHLDRPADLPGSLQPLATAGFELAVPLYANDVLIGCLGLGPYWDEQIFDDRMMEIAQLIGQQAALFLVAAHNVDELRQVPGLMANAQERERERLAQELHDTIQQFLGRLPFYLTVSRNAVPRQPELSQQILDRIIGDVEAAAGDVRRIRQNLAPSQLEHGLATSVVALVNHFQERTGIRTTLRFNMESEDLTDLKSRHAIYRVIQQALDNVEAHADASAVEINLQTRDDRVLFSVRDNGQGLSEARRLAARRDNSYGLESMRARLEACGGAFTLESTPGHGTEVGGWIPSTPANGRFAET